MPVKRQAEKKALRGHAETPSDAAAAYFAYVKVHAESLKPDEARRTAELIQAGLSRCPEPDARKNPAAFLKRHGQTKALFAFERMCLANQRLVISIARKFTPPPMFGLMDLIPEANCGLAVAIARLDPRRGYRPSTHSTWWIRHHIMRWIENFHSLVRSPVPFQKFSGKSRKAERELQSKLGRQPARGELAEHMKVSERRLEDAEQRRVQGFVSLNAKLENEDGAEYLDFLRARDGDPLEAVLSIERSELNELVRRTLERLDDPVDADIVRRYHGFDDDDRQQTLKEIGRIHGLSRERTRVRKNRALARLRELLAEHGIEAL